MDFITPAISLLGAAFRVGRSIKQNKLGNRLLTKIQGQEVPQAALENKTLATRMAAEGMPAEQYALSKQSIDRNNLMALKASADRRGGLGLIPRILQGTNDAYLRLNATNAAMRNSNQRTLLGVNNQIGQYQNQKYQADYNYAMSLKGAANENMNNAFDSAVSGIGYGADSFIRNRRLSRGFSVQKPAVGGGATSDAYGI